MQIKIVDLEKLDRLIAIRGYSRLSFSKKIGQSQSLINQIMNGQINPSPATALKIANELEVDWHELFYLNHRKKKLINN